MDQNLRWGPVRLVFTVHSVPSGPLAQCEPVEAWNFGNCFQKSRSEARPAKSADSGTCPGLDLSGWKADDDVNKLGQPRDTVLHFDGQTEGKDSGLRTEEEYDDAEDKHGTAALWLAFSGFKGVWPFRMRGVGGVNVPRQGVLELVKLGVAAYGDGEQGRDPGARLVALGRAIAC